jgi:hypothetical protein
MEEALHAELLRFATPQTTFDELYFHINQLISDCGFINLDFLGNLGHSIVKDKNDRIYTEKGNTALLDAVNTALAELQADGTVDAIVAKYISAE